MPRPMNVCGHNRLFYFFLMERALFDRHYLLTSAYVFPSGNSLWDVDRRVVDLYRQSNLSRGSHRIQCSSAVLHGKKRGELYVFRRTCGQDRKSVV